MDRKTRLQKIDEAFDGLEIGGAIDLGEEWRQRFLARIVNEARKDDMTFGELDVRTFGRVCRSCLELAWSGEERTPAANQSREEYWRSRLVLRLNHNEDRGTCPVCGCVSEPRVGLWAYVTQEAGPVCSDCVRDLAFGLLGYLGLTAGEKGADDE